MAEREPGEIVLVQSIDDLLDMREWLGERREWLALDIETTGLNVGRDRIRLVQFGDTERAYVIDYRDWRGVVAQVAREYEGRIVLHNALFDLKFLKRDGIAIPQRQVHDTMIMAHLDDPVRRVALKDLGRRHLGPEWGAGQDALKIAFSAAGWDFASVPTDFPGYWTYSGLDTMLTARIAEKLWPRIAEYRVPYEVEMGFIHVLRDAEVTGVAIDADYCQSALAQLQLQIAMLGPEINEYAPKGVQVNPMASEQVVRLLQTLGAELTHRTEKGQLSTDDDVLSSLQAQYPVCRLILDYRHASFLSTSHFEKMLDLAVERDGVPAVHPSTRPVGARTGRTSVADPPLQQIPRGRVVRDGYIARPGHQLVLCDYDGMEMRFMAGDAPCPPMLETFARGDDIHRWTASEVFGVPQDGVDREMRALAKGVNFARIYGAGAPKLAVTAGVTVNRAEAFLAQYDMLFPEVVGWQQRLIDEAARSRTGRDWPHIRTPLGRRLPIEPDKLYKATNFRDQGGCAEIAKQAACRLANAGLGDFFRLFVHDEFILEVPEEIAEDVLRETEQVMTDDSVFEGLTFTASGETVKRWGDRYADEVNPMRRAA